MSGKIDKWTLHFDGGCVGGNPGGTAIGSWVIRGPSNKIVEKDAKIVCKGEGATNNVAEWAGLVYGLSALMQYTEGVIEIVGDSLLVINQLNGVYQVKKEHLKPWKNLAMETLEHFDIWKARHVKRHLNEEADQIGRDKFKELNGE